jgi:hypothetical protein
VAKQGYLAPNDHGGAGGQVAFSYCRSLYALALMFPPKLSSHKESLNASRGFNKVFNIRDLQWVPRICKGFQQGL